jgi:hypothetical protein
MADFITATSNLTSDAERLAHLYDALYLVLPEYDTSRYCHIYSGDALAAIQKALSGISLNDAVADRIDAGISALNSYHMNCMSSLTAAITSFQTAPSTQFIPTLIDTITTAVPGQIIQVFPFLINNLGNTYNETAVRVGLITGLSQSLNDYIPTSSSDATSLLVTLQTLFDDTIEMTSNYAWNETTNSLSELKAAVTDLLMDLITTQPNIISQNYSDNLPACVIAYRMYRDADREKEIMDNNYVQFPGFIPSTVNVKAY